MPRASRMPLTSTPKEVNDFKLVMNRLGMELIQIDEHIQSYNSQLTTKEKAIEELREVVKTDTCLPSNSKLKKSTRTVTRCA